MIRRNSVAYLIMHATVLFALILMGCGGGSGSGGVEAVPPVTLNKTASEQATSAVLSSINLLLEPSYLGAASTEKTKNKNIIEKLILPELVLRAARGTLRAAAAEIIPCTGGGSKTVSISYLGTPEAMLNAHAIINYSACVEGGSIYSGTLDTTMEGAVTMPTKVTSTVTDFSYSDAFTGVSLSFKAATITMDSAQYYANGGIKSAALTISGDISGTVQGKPVNADFKEFTLKYNYGTVGHLYANLSGRLKIPCLTSELSVSTSTDVELINNSPISGFLTVSTTDEKEKATASINDGEITVTDAAGATNKVTALDLSICEV